jgi:hypothetical protein
MRLGTIGILSGTHAIKAVYTAQWAGLDLHYDAGFDTTGYDSLDFAIHGGASGFAAGDLFVTFYRNGNDFGFVSLDDYLPGVVRSLCWRSELTRAYTTFDIHPESTP